MSRCHARLTKWSSRIHIGSSKLNALQVYICNRPAEDGELLCDVCCNRSATHIKHEPRLHGLLTEPIPENSHIYGGTWYLNAVKKFGEPPLDWVLSAKKNQQIAENWIEGACTVEAQSISMNIDKEMNGRKKRAKMIAVNTVAKEAIFPSEVRYIESDKPILKVATDSYVIQKGEHNGVPVWILPNGKMFDMDAKGEPRNLINTVA